MERVLFVDDEERLLAGMRRNLRKEFDVHTALSGAEGLELIEEQGPFAVIVSDMQMPEMNGVEFLVQAKKRAPDTIRIMLTGNADQQTAVAAINTGDVHQFLNKPCEGPQMVEALHEAVEAYRRRRIEQDLLQRTFQASVDVLVEILSLANPAAFGRSGRLADLATQIAEDMSLDETWVVRSAALLSQIGCINLPANVVEAVTKGAAVGDAEWQRYAEQAAVGAGLIERIPRLEPVAEAIRYQHRNYNGSGTPDDGVAGDDIPIIARVLRVVLEIDSLQSRGNSSEEILRLLKSNAQLFDPAVLASAEAVFSTLQQGEERLVDVKQLAPNMVLAEDVQGSNGVLLVCRGWEMSDSVIRHLQRAAQNDIIEPQVKVIVRSPAD